MSKKTRKKDTKKTKKVSTASLNAIFFKIFEYTIWALIAGVMIYIASAGTKTAYDFGYQLFDRQQRNVESKELSITIAKDQKLSEVGKALEDAGIIDNAFVFRIQGILYDLEIKPGTYVVNTRTSSLDLLEQFNEGPVN